MYQLIDILRHPEDGIFPAGGSDEGADDPKPEDDKGDDKTPTIEIDGKEYTVDEVKKGMMLQSDYTRKTQETARRERELNERERSLDSGGGGDDGDKDSDVAREIASLRKDLDADRKDKIQDRVDRDIEKLRNDPKYGDVFKEMEEEIINYILDSGAPDIATGFRLWKGDNIDLFTEKAIEKRKAGDDAHDRKKKDAETLGTGKTSGKTGGKFKIEPGEDINTALKRYSEGKT